MKKKVLFLAGAACLTAAWMQAAPRLALCTPPELTRPIWIVEGSDGPADLTLTAYNAGDGELDPAVDGGFAAWLAPELAPAGPCASDPSVTGPQVLVRLNTADLAPGVHEGVIIVRAPGAVDAPQRVPIQLFVGGAVPDEIDLYVPPVDGATDSIDFRTPDGPAPELDVAGSFLSVSSNNLGSFRFVHDHRLIGRYSPGLPTGENPGSLFVEGSTFEPDNGVIPVRLNVTTEPIARLSADSLRIATATGVVPPAATLIVSNRGQGELTIDSVETAGGDWLSAEVRDGGVIVVTADPAGLDPGLQEGELTIAGNAANGPLVVPVSFSVSESAAPTAAFRGAVNGATFENTKPLAPLTIATVFGEQLSYGIAQADALPLPTELNGTRVLVNGVPAPLFFVSYDQVNFQTPEGLDRGDATVRVERDGEAGNEILTRIGERSIGIFLFNRGEYGAIRNATQGNFPLPRSFSAPGFETAPARPGDVLEIFATGLGPVTPDIVAGEAAPASPLANVIGNAVVNVGFGFLTPQRTPLFVGLTPGFAGLYQINLVVPEDLDTNLRTPLVLRFPDGAQLSNVVEIAVER